MLGLLQWHARLCCVNGIAAVLGFVFVWLWVLDSGAVVKIKIPNKLVTRRVTLARDVNC